MASSVIESTDFQTLATGYASFLAALGGACVTILTLVLTLTRDSDRRDTLFPALVMGLINFALSAFIGTQLMTEVSGMSDFHSRYFVIAEVNLFVTGGCFVHSLLLLALVYDDRARSSLHRFTFFIFSMLFLSIFGWLIVTLALFLVLDTPLAILLAMAALLSFFIAYKSKPASPVPYCVSAIAIVFAMSYFAVTLNWYQAPTALDFYVMAVSSVLGVSPLFGSGCAAFRFTRAQQ